MVNALMAFRLVYLRAVAKAWEDDNFKNQLLERETVLERRTIFNSLKSEFLFVNPWKHVNISMIDDGDTKWDPEATAGWVGPNNSFVIYLPEKPLGHESEALAAYYELFPTLFGGEKTIEQKKAEIDRDEGDAEIEEMGDDDRPDASLPLGLGVGPDNFLEFGALTLRAIALAWNEQKVIDGVVTSPEEGFLLELLDASKPLDDAQEKYRDATSILGKYLGYNNPWNFGLSFETAPDFTWDVNNRRWENVPNNLVILHFPNPPSKKEELWPIALTSYNNTGPEYPFSCV